MLKIKRMSKNRTHTANQLPDHMDNNGATWTRQGQDEAYNVKYNAHTKQFTVKAVYWDFETQDWAEVFVPENEHPDLTLYIP